MRKRALMAASLSLACTLSFGAETNMAQMPVDQKTGELHGGAVRELALGGRPVGY